MSQPITVFVYGHYDSRGGTTALLAADRKEADAEYGRLFEDEFADVTAKEDFLGVCTLRGIEPEHPSILDLEDCGAVFIEGQGENDEFPENIDGKTLVYWPEPRKEDGEVVVPEGHYHPRWEDDAFGFVFMSVPKMKEEGGK